MAATFFIGELSVSNTGKEGSSYLISSLSTVLRMTSGEKGETPVLRKPLFNNASNSKENMLAPGVHSSAKIPGKVFRVI
ncbi:hypothetical protein RvY_13131 [Ramazzottius varieornatus]|uniref:Uncharacterized protein n=1 Tax=Ramazzottius varieornatus TaxID=947166 RepID=A0A1D1VLW6_RAMVA|nr:hypothetical protein RvY_13131 [Ramazzottius varieornatus]